MSETTDPVIDAVRQTARVQDIDLDTAEFRAAIAQLRPSPRRRHRTQLALVAAAAVVVAGIGGWQLVAPSAGQPSASPTGADGMQLVAARFDAAAAEFPLPKGQTYDSLRSDVLARDDSATSKQAADAAAALVARYAGCKWIDLQISGKFNELSPQEQADVQNQTQKALPNVVKATDGRRSIPQSKSTIQLKDVRDKFCKDVE